MLRVPAIHPGARAAGFPNKWSSAAPAMILRHYFDFPWAVDDDDDVEVPPDGPQQPFGPNEAQS